MKLDRPQNKTEHVCDILSKEIRSGSIQPGARLSSMRELCDRFGVSIAVINSAYNVLERRGLIERRVGSGTYAAMPPEKRGEVFGVLTSIKSRFMDGYYHSILEAAAESGDTLIPQYLPPGDKLNDSIDRMLAQNPAALMLDLQASNYSLSQILTRVGSTPICFANRYEWDEPLAVRASLVDYTGMTALAVGKFRAAGHRRIVYLGNEPDPLPFERRMLEEAAARNGLAWPSLEFDFACAGDVVSNRARLDRLFGGEDHATALIARGDSVLYNFDVRLRVIHSRLGPIEKVGCFDTVWSRLPMYEFRSFRVDFKRLWLDAMEMFNQPPGSSVCLHMPDWPEAATEEDE